tara:strand:- start:4066 stop:4791 length:726 start_codon:yes stop_codon:yes gene_type:complete
MSTLKATTIEPATGTNVTLGTTGDTVALPGNTLVLDTWKDSGGNTLFTSDGSGTVSNVNAGLAGAGPVLIQSQTASGSSSIAFTSGLDSTYDRYMFVFVSINPASDAYEFQFQGSTNGGSSYGVNITSTAFRANHEEGGGGGTLSYATGRDLANSTSYQSIGMNVGNGADESVSGVLNLFSPSSTTYVKQFYSTSNQYWNNNSSGELFIGGYFNSTSAINAIDFKMSSGNFDGIIKLYGVK